MKARLVTILAITGLWGLLLWAGANGVAGIEAQHAPGYPSVEQIGYYAGVPAMACLLGLAGATFSLKRKSPATLVIGFMLAAALLPYLFMYGGGV